MSQFDWLITQKNEIMKATQNFKSSNLKYRVPPEWPPPYISERRTTFAKAYGIKVRCCYWELFGGTCQEPGNSLLS